MAHLASTQSRELYTMGWDERKSHKMRCNWHAVSGGQDNIVQKALRGDAVRLLQSRLSHVKFKGAFVPFLHPNNEPHTYLGVDITPTMNWAFQVDKVMRDMKDNGQKLEGSMLSRTQQLYFVKTVTVAKA